MDELAMDEPLYPSLWSLCIAGCVVWPGLFIVFWSILSQRYPPHLACGTAMRLVSCAHAVVQFVFGCVTMSRTYADVFWEDCKLLDQSTAFCTMYWLYDVAAMYLVYCREKQMMQVSLIASLRRFLRENPLVVFHHFVVIGGGHPLILHYRFGKAAFMIACVQVTEMSTPFLNFRKIFIKHHFTDSILFRVNTALAVATFFLTRIVLFPCIYLIYAYSYQQTLWEVVTSMYFGCHFVMVGVTLMQVTWFTIFIGALTKERKPKTIQNGHQNGLQNGIQNGLQNGHKNGHQNGLQNGHQNRHSAQHHNVGEIGYTKKSE